MARAIDSFLDSSSGNSTFIVATVVDNLDTKEAYKETGKMIGRVKIAIKGVSDELKKEDSPWAYVMQPIGSGSHEGIGSFIIPAVGTKVICTKLNNQNGYIVLGELNTTQHNLKDYATKDYPEVHGKRDKTGNKSVINMKTGDAFQQQSGGSWLNVNKASTDADVKGHLVIKTKKVTIEGDLYVKGKINSSGDVTAGVTSLMKHQHITMAKPGPPNMSVTSIGFGTIGTPDKLNTNVPLNSTSTSGTSSTSSTSSTATSSTPTDTSAVPGDGAWEKDANGDWQPYEGDDIDDFEDAIKDV